MWLAGALVYIRLGRCAIFHTLLLDLCATKLTVLGILVGELRSALMSSTEQDEFTVNEQWLTSALVHESCLSGRRRFRKQSRCCLSRWNQTTICLLEASDTIEISPAVNNLRR